MSEALTEADKAGLDLVEVAPGSVPPVCRVMDYGKYRYQQSKKLNAAKRSSAVIHVKEIRVRPKTEEHDLQVKLRHIERFLEQNNKVKITMMFRGREIVYADKGKALMDDICERLKEVGMIDQPPKREGRNIIMIISPKK